MSENVLCPSTLRLEPYLSQREKWPPSGRHILAQFDANTVVVYQAFRADIARFACRNGYFGGGFSLDRMSWIKPNFLWMMYRCGWAAKADQEAVLAVSIHRAAFDGILGSAVPSSYEPENYGSREAWQKAVAESDVRLQWDPDHDPSGKPLARRAIQLGLRGRSLVKYSRESIVRIEDISGFVRCQKSILDNDGPGLLQTPAERIYPIPDCDASQDGGL